MAKKTASEGSVSAGKKLVIVESPTKAKTIRKFLGKDYIVESCMGHIRDLPQSAKDIPEKFRKEKWSKLGVNVEKDFEPLYTIPNNKVKVVKTLKDKLAEATELYLATDEDREGESISWHLLEVLKPKVPVKRMVFHEITKEAISNSLTHTRKLDENLVRAQEARRILDRLVGYTISPLIWKKVAFGLSAGRVQSVAVRLIVEKELERARFKKAQYWGIEANLEKDNAAFSARLHTLKGERIATGKDFDPNTGALADSKNVLVLNQKAANELAGKLKQVPWKVSEVEEKPVNRRPSAPFITSTLQQEANRKLGMSSRETMQVAQKLYEEGLITYMRTDSTSLSEEAMNAARKCIQSKYGKEYLPASPINYAAKKVKGAQEAHEAIRPAGQTFIDPEATGLSGAQLKLYELIWKRTVASQMVDARQKQVSVKLQAGDAIFSASGMTIEFPGFLRAYVEGSDDPEAELSEREVRLPALRAQDVVKAQGLTPTEHETKPSARFTEASLVQTMEKEGIGRPSTYASVIGTIIDRGYVQKVANALVPTFTAMVVSKLLKNYLPQYVDLNFTSEMEKSLDDIADGDLDWLKYLGGVYLGPKGLMKQVETQEKKIDPDEARAVKLEGLNQYTFKVGRYGAYVEKQIKGETMSASIPDKEAPADITSESIEKWIEQKAKGADSLGKDPETGRNIYVLTGRYGPYAQLGENEDEDVKPKRVSLPPGVEVSQVDMKMALEILSLPKKVGVNPINNKDIKIGVGRFGPYVECAGDYRSIPKTETVFTMTLDKAIELLKQPKKSRGRAAPLKEFGAHPATGEMVQLLNGPYGLYLKVGKTNVSLPKDEKPESVTMARALELLGTEVSASKSPKNKGKAAKPAAVKAKATGAKKAKVASAKASVASKVVVKAPVKRKERAGARARA